MWVPAAASRDELLGLVAARLAPLMQQPASPGAAGATQEEEEVASAAGAMVDLWRFLHHGGRRASGRDVGVPAASANEPAELLSRGGSAGLASACRALSPRDLVGWAAFIARAAPSLGVWAAVAHGAFLTVIDGLGLGLGLADDAVAVLQAECRAALAAVLPPAARWLATAAKFDAPPDEANGGGGGDANARAVGPTPGFSFGFFKEGEVGVSIAPSTGAADPAVPSRVLWGTPPFVIPCGPLIQPGAGSGCVDSAFELTAPSAARNVARLLRALQAGRPVLLEGSPGVGKSAVAAALAAASGHRLIRVGVSFYSPSSAEYERDDILIFIGRPFFSPLHARAPPLDRSTCRSKPT